MSTLAHWCYRYRRAVPIGWALLLAGLAAGAVWLGTAFTTAVNLPHSESATAYALLAEAAPASAGTTTGTIVWHTDSTPVGDPAVRGRAEGLLTRVAAVPGVSAVVSPYTPAGVGQIDAAGRTAYARIVLGADADTGPVKALVEEAGTGALEIAYGGAAFDTEPSPSHGMEAVGILAALVLLLVMFRSIWAAVLPIVTGLVGVGASLLLVVLGSHAVDLDSTSLTMGALIGLGVGIDYALFIVDRTRKGLLAGAPVPEAIATAVNTSGRAVVFAGGTVVAALLGIAVVGLDVLTGMGRAAAVTVGFTVLASITLLPALLGLIGDRMLSRSQRRRLSHRVTATPPRHAARDRGSGWARLVLRLPRSTALLALLVIVALASPVAMIRIGDADASSDPAGSPSHRYHRMVSRAFGAGFDAAVLLVAETPDAASAAAFAGLLDRVRAGRRVAAVTPATASADRGVSWAGVVPTASAQTETTADLVTDLRERIVPKAAAGTRLRVHVGGKTATDLDLSAALLGRLPLYLGLVALLGFLLLMVAFRSVPVPLVGALTTVTTILVGMGAITTIFQLGHGIGVFDVGSGAPVMYIVPIIVVGVVCGLSMDYQVFLVSRIHEEWTTTGDNRRAVRVGLTETAPVITTAALIMLAVFASFSFTGERIVSAIGIGLASAVFVDAFAARLTLVPAVMTLLGRRNWSYPRWAERITPHLSVEGATRSATAGSVTAGSVTAGSATAGGAGPVRSGSDPGTDWINQGRTPATTGKVPTGSADREPDTIVAASGRSAPPPDREPWP